MESVMRGELAAYVARRLAITLLTLFAVSILIFVVLEVVPGDAARLRVGPFATESQYLAMRQELGLDRPALIRYLSWLVNFITGNWGESWRLSVPILPLIGRALGNSALLAGTTFLLVIPISLVAGSVAAVYRGRFIDYAIVNIGLVGVALPEFLIGTFLIVSFSIWIPVLPSSSLIPDGTGFLASSRYLILPAASLALVLFGYISRMMRANTIDELRRAYVRSAILKGLPLHVVLIKHVFRNALLPSITVITNQVSWLVAGLVVIENLFNYPGVGKLLVAAALGHDLALLEVTVMLKATILMLTNLAGDLLYGLANPRLRFHSKVAK